MTPDRDRVLRELSTLKLATHRPIYPIPTSTGEIRFEALCKAWWRYRWSPKVVAIYGNPDIATRFDTHTDEENLFYERVLPAFERFVTIEQELSPISPIWLVFMSSTGEEFVIRRALVDELATRPTFSVLQFSRPIHKNVGEFVKKVLGSRGMDPTSTL